jgi:Ca2+-binding EF-hand superfamily protein
MAYDRDGDGRVTKMELPRRRHAALDQADANQDGAVDRDELTGFAERLKRGDAAPDAAR